MKGCFNSGLLAILLVLSCKLTAAAVLEVGPVGYDYTSIQEAINDASPYYSENEIILVHDGTYVENIDFCGKAITVCAENGPTTCFIDGNATGSVVTFSFAEGGNSVLDGFTIENGLAETGGGIYCSMSSPSITNCTIFNNRARENGGGMACVSNSSPEITHCNILSNTSENDGGGIYCDHSSPRIIHCTISQNTAFWHGGGLNTDNYSSPLIRKCTVGSNTALWGDGGGIYSFYHSQPEVFDCIINDNTAAWGGGGIFLGGESSSAISDCIIHHNRAEDEGGGGIYCADSNFSSIRNCIIIGNFTYGTGGGIFCVDIPPMITRTVFGDNKAAGDPQVYLNVNVFALGLLKLGDAGKIAIPKYTECKGRWEASYYFFGKSCGLKFPIDSGEVCYIHFF